jgi:hypothetical protein
MQLETNIRYPDRIGISDALRDIAASFTENIHYGEEPLETKESKFNFEQVGEIGGRELYSISEYTDEQAILKIATTEEGRDANLVEAYDRKLLPAAFRQHIVPSCDIMFSGRGIIQLSTGQNTDAENMITPARMLTEITENTTDITLDITRHHAAWFQDRPVLQHWGDLLR